VRNFAQSRRWGIYFRVLKEGPLEVGDEVIRVYRHAAKIPVYDLARVTVSTATTSRPSGGWRISRSSTPRGGAISGRSWRVEWGWKTFVSPGSIRSRGVGRRGSDDIRGFPLESREKEEKRRDD